MKSLLVSLADENYIDQAKQLFSSVYFNAGWQGDYMLLAHEIPEEKLKWFLDKGILVKECKPLFEGKLESEHPTTVLCKFYIFTPEFKKWDNIVFLDADMIVRHSIQKLSKVKGFYATVDFNNSLLEKQFHKNIPNNLLFNKLSNEFNLDENAFNTGVIAFDTSIITNNLLDSLKELFEKYREICKYGEQPIINLYFYKKWKKLNTSYNVNIPIIQQHYHIKSKKIKGHILHFLGRNKPWNINNDFYDEWIENFKKAYLIDLSNNPIENNRQNLQQYKIYYYFLYINVLKIIFDLLYFIAKKIGLIGIFLKKSHPRFYLMLKKTRKK